MGGIVLLPFMALLVAFSAVPATTGALPVLDWDSQGGIDWSSGYIVGYGASRYGMASVNGSEGSGLNRNEAMRKARRLAADYIYRLCLGITIQEKLRVRDYIRDDPDLRSELRRAVKAAPTWAVRLEGEGRLSVAVLYPVGGSGLSGLLGRIKGWYGEEGWRPPETIAADPQREEAATGIVFIVGAPSYSPALRPRIMGSDGTTFVSFERSGRTARNRAAFMPYYTDFEAGLADPLLGENPRLVKVLEVRGTDIVVPAEIESLLLTTPTGNKIVEDVRMIVVRQ